METVYKVFYFGQKVRNAQLRERLEKQKLQTEKFKRQAESFYNSYMSECDRINDMREAFMFATCENCREEIVLASRGNKLNYCPKCGAPLYVSERISKWR